MPKTIFIRSAPISAILVNIPPAIRNALAPRDSPMANPIKLAPASSRGTYNNIINIMMSSTETKSTPMLMPASRAIFKTLRGFLSREENAVLLLARVFIRIPYQATLYEPRIPITVHIKMNNTPPMAICCRKPK